VLFKTINSGTVIALRTLTLISFLACTANTALARDSLITRANYVSSAPANAPAILRIHGSFGVGNIPVVTLGDISTATMSGNPASADLVVTSFSTTDIVVTVPHPIDSGLLPATYRLNVRTFDAATREWNAVNFDLALGAPFGAVFSGSVTAIPPSGSTLTVLGRTVIVDANTKFGGAGNPLSLADLKVGDRVEIGGQLQADGSVLALSIVRLP
jgi:hypothetical protein